MKIAIAVGLLLLSSVASFAGCKEGDKDTVSDDGEIIELLDRLVYRSLDPATSSTWLSADSVLICGDVMINKDEGGEKSMSFQIS